VIAMTLGEIARVVGAQIRPAARAAGPTGGRPADVAAVTVTSVEFDSRRVLPGALFVALPGVHADGHDFAAAATQAGAVAVLGLRAVPELPTLVVPAPASDAPGRVTDGVLPAAMPLLAALSALAAHVAARLVTGGLTIVGVTGSAGKTSTKDLIAAVLSRAGSVVAPPESFNNELGHPYTVLRAEAGTDYLVLELSARGVGHIAGLAAAAPPRVGAVLNVGSAHLGEFGSREAIARAKGELVEALPAAADGGVAVLNADDPLVAGMASRTAAAVVRFGVGPDAEVRAEDVTLDPAARAAFTLVTPEGSAPVRLQVVGGHQVSNALAAAAVGRAAGMDVVTVAEALSAAGPASKWRMAVSDLPGGVTLINDAYNANPESMRAALAALTTLAGGRRRWAVLGTMAELGPFAADAHLDVGRAAAESGARVLVVGEAARGIADGASAGPTPDGGAVAWVPDLDAAAQLLLSQVAPGDVVLVKASRSIGLERLALRLAQALPSLLAGTPPAGTPDRREAT
jgi:UDP-N-acetylmuramoyl-tripeptide--D-alanyl-D-alanine ligase